MRRSLSYRSSVRRFFHGGFSAQDIVESWSTIATLAEHVDAVLTLHDGEAASMAERTRPGPEEGGERA